MFIFKRILIVEDDIYIGNMLEELLTREGYAVTRAYSGTEAYLMSQKDTSDLVLLDLMLPGMPGEEVLKHFAGVPVIILSAKVHIDDKVKLLLEGAYDYITKPFDTRELLARVTVALRKTEMIDGAGRLTFRDIEINAATHEVSVCGAMVKLTRTEYAILKLLMTNPKQVVTKTILLDRISADTPDCTESSLKIHISNIRKKLREAGKCDYIESVWGIGFKMITE